MQKLREEIITSQPPQLLSTLTASLTALASMKEGLRLKARLGIAVQLLL